MGRIGSGFGIYSDKKGTGDITGSGTSGIVARFVGAKQIGDGIIRDDGTTTGVGTAAVSTSYMTFAAATTGLSSLNVAPTAAVDVAAPVSGDLWWNGTNLYFYNGSTNKDLLTGGGTETLQQTITAGATYTGAQTITINTSDDLTLTATDVGVSQAFVEISTIGTSAEIGVVDITGGTGQSLIMDNAAIILSDTTNLKGVIYGADYSSNFTARSLVDKAYVDGLADLNGIYTGSGSTPNDTEVTIGNDLVFIGATNTNVQGVRFQNSDNSHTFIIENGGNVRNTGSSISAKVGTTGATFGSGRVLEIIGAGSQIARIIAPTGLGRVDVSTISNHINMALYETGGTIKINLQTGGGSGTYFVDKVAIGHTVPAAGTILHTTAADVKIEGLTDTNLLVADYSADTVNVGSATGASKFNVTGNIEIIGANTGLILEDRTLSTRYEAYMDNGTWTTNAL